VVAGEQLLAQRDARPEVVLPGVDLGLEALVVVHQQLHAGHVPRLLRGVHLADEVLHPDHQDAHHVKEAEQIARIGQFLFAGIAHRLQIVPGMEHLLFPVGDLLSLVAGIGVLRFSTSSIVWPSSEESRYGSWAISRSRALRLLLSDSRRSLMSAEA